jgi:hypothetical protein
MYYKKKKFMFRNRKKKKKKLNHQIKINIFKKISSKYLN